MNERILESWNLETKAAGDELAAYERPGVSRMCEIPCEVSPSWRL